jgi:uncharacterized protein YjbI with pentapeptide repeats
MTYRCFFPRGVRKAPLVLGALNRKSRWATGMAFCILLAVALAPVAYWLSFREGRWAGEPRPSSFKEWGLWMAGEPPKFPEVALDYASTANGVVFGLFPDRLKLASETIVGEKLLDETKKEIASRGGDFVPTIKFDGRDLQAANLSGADLRGLSLNGATLQGANLEFARLDGARLNRAQLQGADLGSAQLERVNLSSADLRGARFNDPLSMMMRQMQSFMRSMRSITDTAGSIDTDPLVIKLGVTQLQGANLTFAHLQGVDLEFAQLQGADLAFAQLQGDDLGNAELQGTDLSRAQLQGANLGSAQLQGADLEGAQLQGADISDANLADSIFANTFVFRTTAGANLSIAAVRSEHSDQTMGGQSGFELKPLTQTDVDAWIADATQLTPKDEKDGIVKRFGRLKKGFQTADKDASDSARWKTFEDPNLFSSDPQRRQRLAKAFGDLACERAGAPYIALGLIRQGDITKNYRLSALGDQFGSLRARMAEGRKNPEKCPGVVGFTEDDWRALDEIKDE